MGDIATYNLTDAECPSSAKVALEFLYLNSSCTFFTAFLLSIDSVAVLGILGNIATAVILLQRHMRNKFNRLLVALAFFDSILLLTTLAYSIVCVYRDACMIAYPYILWPTRCFAITSSTFMTVVIATERFMAVCHPLKYKPNKHHHVLKCISAVTILAMMFTTTKFMEYEPDDCTVIRVTKLYKNNVYIIYNAIIYKFMVTGLIPGLILVFLYVKIYKAIKASHLMQRRCSATVDNQVNETMRRMENRRARIYAGVVITFLICNTPDSFLKIAYIMKTVKSTEEPPQWFSMAVIVRTFFLNLNSAMNCVIYTCLSKKFRKEFKRVLGRLKGSDIALASRVENYITPNSVPTKHQYGIPLQNFV